MPEGKAMTTYDVVHLVIHATGGTIQGRTKLQKVIYFVGVLTDRLKQLGYRAHYYGPYSSDVAGAIQELRSLGFLEQRTTGVGTTDNFGFEVTRYDYTLTDEGKQVAAEKAAAHAVEWDRIRKAVTAINAAPVQDYVRLAVAAKTHLLTQQAGSALEPDALKAKAQEHGWSAFTPEQYDDAIRFLTAVGLDRETTASGVRSPG